MKKNIYIRPCCTIVPLSTTLCDFPVVDSKGDSYVFSKEHSFTMEEETTTGWENE